jgi:hypothetical protein
MPLGFPKLARWLAPSLFHKRAVVRMLTWWTGCSGQTASAIASEQRRSRPNLHLCRRRKTLQRQCACSRGHQAALGDGWWHVPEPRSLIGVVARGAAEPVGMLNSFVRCSSRGVAPVLSGCTDFESGLGVISLFSASPAVATQFTGESSGGARVTAGRGRRENRMMVSQPA